MGNAAADICRAKHKHMDSDDTTGKKSGRRLESEGRERHTQITVKIREQNGDDGKEAVMAGLLDRGRE